ncbi:MAG: hypothetical protein J5I47_00905 [Vicingus serpentipes]|nr:hypothetical protein [Vicingus serpentipes]
MKELHNHIFSSTACLSKKTMLKYMNKQLSKNELHDVEKHLLDCEFCSDAFEGIKIAQNSSMLFAIDNKIDQRVRSVEKNNPLMRNLMVAASILIIVFGAYFTFNNTFHSQKEYIVLEEKPQVSHSEPIVPKDIIIGDSSEKRWVETTLTEKKESVIEVPKVSITQNNADRSIEEDDDKIFFDEEIIADESTILLEEDMEPHAEIKEEIVQQELVTPNAFPASEAKKEDDLRVKLKKSSARKSVKKDYSGKTYMIDTYKIYDYAEEYQYEYDFKKAAQPQATAPDFANEKEKERVENTLEKTTVEITYKEVLELGVKYLKNQEYQQAIAQFNLILATHPKDINALFYNGVCFYNIGEYNKAKTLFDQTISNKNEVFNEEAEWYKALTTIEIDKKEAKQLLQAIIDANGFYKNQAIEKLKDIKQ